jgi:hypothetical protein
LGCHYFKVRRIIRNAVRKFYLIASDGKLSGGTVKRDTIEYRSGGEVVVARGKANSPSKDKIVTGNGGCATPVTGIRPGIVSSSAVPGACGHNLS